MFPDGMNYFSPVAIQSLYKALYACLNGLFQYTSAVSGKSIGDVTDVAVRIHSRLI